MKWTDRELREANLIHGPERLKSDTYRLHIPKDGDKDGKMLDVPGWMVGDPAAAELVLRAAAVIRERVTR